MGARKTRRQFLRTSAAVGVGFWAAGGVQAAQNRPGPNDRLNIGIIGAGGQGGGNLRNVAKTENIVALCDIDERHAGKSFESHPKAARYHDYRVMLEKQKDIDAVVVSTADHMHAFASIMAMRLGKHVYCEKPLTHSVWEARQMREVAAKHKVATQMGNGGTASSGLREGVEVLQSGAIGDIREVHIWTNRPGKFWRQGHTSFPKGQEVPKHIHWDLWLGGAPERPYHSDLHPFRWRGWWDFGTGALGDMGCHTMNLAFWALRLGEPAAISAETDQPVNNVSPPNGCKVTYEFGARGNLPPCRVYWYEVRQPPAELLQGEKPRSSGSLFIGSKGTLYSPSDNGASYTLLPRAAYESYKPPQPTIPRSPGHHAEWIRACKGGPPAKSNFVDHAGPLTEFVLLGNVAMRVGKRIVWDAARLRCPDCPAADQFIRREYRKGWTL